MIKKLVLAGVLSSASMLAQADIYAGFQHGSLYYKDQDLSDTSFRPNALMLKFGGEVNENVAIELRGAFGLNDDSQYSPYDAVPASAGVAEQPSGFESYTASVTTAYGIYAKFFTTFGEGVIAKPYFSLGYGAVEIELKNESRLIDDPDSLDPNDMIPSAVVDNGLDESGMQMAAGVDLQLTESFAFNVEYISLYDDKEDQVRGITAGFNFFF